MIHRMFSPFRRCAAAWVGAMAIGFCASAWASGNVDFSLGAREDYLRWSISDYDRNPDILSELTWKDLHTTYIALRGRYEIDNFVAAASYGFGYIASGDNQDSDYHSSGRNDEFSRSNNDTNGDDVRDREISAGVVFLSRHIVKLTGGFGYARREIDLVITNGYQTIPTPGPIYNLRSTYSATINGPLVWFGGEIHFYPQLAGEFAVKKGFYAYSANADWNLRDEFAHPRSYSQSTDGESNSIALRLRWNVSPVSVLSFGIDYEKFTASGGYTRFYLADGTVGQQPMHAVEFWTWVLSAGIGASF